MPHDLYWLMAQLLAARCPGLAVRRGPTESNSACASCFTCELSIPSRQMRAMFGSDDAPACADCATSGAAASDTTATAIGNLRRKVMCGSTPGDYVFSFAAKSMIPGQPAAL